uniref:Uncharacterized protein n=1 Tax=Arundo donax TaxID=35708 RepID=A0A0A9FEF1_ARUDO
MYMVCHWIGFDPLDLILLQGSCGSFSTLGALEGAHYLTTSKLVECRALRNCSVSEACQS